MKKTSLVALFMVIVVQGFSQFIPLTPSYPSSVNLFDLFEVSFKIPWNYSNPYDPDTILVYGVFTGPDNSSDTVHAFYYEEYSFQEVQGFEVATHNSSNDGWRIRYTPTKTGTWAFKIRGFDAQGELTVSYMNVNYTFTCNSISSGEGFISKANSKFLKRDVVKNGSRQFRSFFPIGPNICWYSCKYSNGIPVVTKPKGIFDYEIYIDSLDGNANYMRVFLNRFQYLSLYGPEYALSNGQTIVYFDKSINQKDSAELDYIITYALQHGVNIMPCIFNCGAFIEANGQDANDSTIWANNPFNSILELENPCDFFTDPDAIRISKNLIRYIISRWGYATNIVAWEFWNEVGNMLGACDGDKHIEQDVRDWHNEMTEYVANLDPFNHCITTSVGNSTNNCTYLFSLLYDNLDIVQHHKYENIQKAASAKQLSYLIHLMTDSAQTEYPIHPFFMGEFGFGQGSPSPSYSEKDPYGIDLHNSLWSSMFSTSIGPASFWWWHYLRTDSLFCRHKPLYVFCENLPILSETFTAYQTGHEEGLSLVFPNNLETYYMINAAEDTIYGWSQDTAFAYQSLRRLTDDVYPPNSPIYPNHFITGSVFDPLGYVYTLDISKRPQPSSNSNTIEIPITNQNVGIYYSVTWYNSETGLKYTGPGMSSTACVHINGDGRKVISFDFPSYIRDLQNHTVNNTFGDAVFVVKKKHVQNSQ